MEFWQAIAFTPPDQLVDFARSAEAMGFDGVTAGDHFVTPARIDSPYHYTADGKPWVLQEASVPDPLVLAGALGQVTTRLRFLVTAYILPMRSPLAAAKAISTAAVLTGDRLVLGVGVGWMKEEFEIAGQDFHTRGRRCDEALEVVRSLFRGGMVEHHGEFYDFPPVQMAPVPERPVPILIGGNSDPAFRRAARHDGWIGAHYPLSDVPGHVKRFDELRSQQGVSHRPRQAIVALEQQPTPDDIRRLEDAGITGLIQMPLLFDGQPVTPFEAKREAMARFSERCIEPFRS